MPEVVVQGVRVAYETAGDGFPLVLLPGPQGQRDVWLPYMPLLGELCRVIAYECHEGQQEPQHGGPHTSTGTVDTLRTFLAVLDLERVYLASQSVGWPVALHFALQHPECLEGLVLIGAHDVEMDTVRGAMPVQTRLPELTVPTLVLLETQGHVAFGATASAQGVALPHSPSDPSPALRLGHAMMQFLLHCERQRHLVRGASFLL